MFLLPVPASPIVLPIVIDAGVLARHQEKARLRRRRRRPRDHGGEEIPPRIVAAAGEAPDPGGPIAARDRHRLADRRIRIPRRWRRGRPRTRPGSPWEGRLRTTDGRRRGRTPRPRTHIRGRWWRPIRRKRRSRTRSRHKPAGCRTRNSSASRMRSMTSSAMRRFASVSCARSRTISAIARARDSNSGTSGLRADDRMAVTVRVIASSRRVASAPQVCGTRSFRPGLWTLRILLCQGRGSK